MKNMQIVFTKINKAELINCEDRDIRENEVRVKIVVSTTSPGTERANITGDLNVSVASSQSDKPIFPRYSGYSSAGVVVKPAKMSLR